MSLLVGFVFLNEKALASELLGTASTSWIFFSGVWNKNNMTVACGE